MKAGKTSPSALVYTYRKQILSEPLISHVDGRCQGPRTILELHVK